MRAISLTMKQRLIKYSVLAYVGFTTYITMEVCFRGYSYPLMGLLGVISIWIIGSLNDRISMDMDLILQCLIGGVLITLLELGIGLLDLNVLHWHMWDYTNQLFNYKGIICLKFSLLWCLMSLVAIILEDVINYYFLWGQRPYYKIFKEVVFRLPRK